MSHDIEAYWSALHELAASMPLAKIEEMAAILLDCYRREGTVFVLGNGGSAASASHFACDLAKGTQNGYTPAFRVMPLTDNVPLMTAWGNDTSYERVFAEQLRALVRPRDVVVMISVSGNSPNVLAAGRVAREVGAISIGLSGRSGGALASLTDHLICVPTDSMELAEDAHIAICHSVCVALRGMLGGMGAVIEAELLVEEAKAEIR